MQICSSNSSNLTRSWSQASAKKSSRACANDHGAPRLRDTFPAVCVLCQVISCGETRQAFAGPSDDHSLRHGHYTAKSELGMEFIFASLSSCGGQSSQLVLNIGCDMNRGNAVWSAFRVVNIVWKEEYIDHGFPAGERGNFPSWIVRSGCSSELHYTVWTKHSSPWDWRCYINAPQHAWVPVIHSPCDDRTLHIRKLVRCRCRLFDAVVDTVGRIVIDSYSKLKMFCVGEAWSRDRFWYTWAFQARISFAGVELFVDRGLISSRNEKKQNGDRKPPRSLSLCFHILDWVNVRITVWSESASYLTKKNRLVGVSITFHEKNRLVGVSITSHEKDRLVGVRITSHKTPQKQQRQSSHSVSQSCKCRTCSIQVCHCVIRDYILSSLEQSLYIQYLINRSSKTYTVLYKVPPFEDLVASTTGRSGRTPLCVCNAITCLSHFMATGKSMPIANNFWNLIFCATCRLVISNFFWRIRKIEMIELPSSPYCLITG